MTLPFDLKIYGYLTRSSPWVLMKTVFKTNEDVLQGLKINGRLLTQSNSINTDKDLTESL